jgi:ornithine cyclodeaminase
MAIILTQSEVRSLLPMATCIDLMADALTTLAREEAVNPLRTLIRLPEGRGILGMMPGAMTSPPTFGMKLVAVMPGNHGTEYDAHQGVVVLFDERHGLPLAVMDASEITAIRTAAVSGLATRLLAREDAGDLAILGSGVQARTHLEAMRCVRSIRRARVFSRDRERREAFAARESERQGIVVEPVDSAEACVSGADLICTTTTAREPVLRGEWIAAGAHVNAAGACVPTARELDTEAVVRARVFADRRESALAEAGDFLIPREEGAVGDDHIAGELGEILLERVAGRVSDEQVTLFESLGIAVEDLAAGHHVWNEARERGVGTEVALGGVRS